MAEPLRLNPDIASMTPGSRLEAIYGQVLAMITEAQAAETPDYSAPPYVDAQGYPVPDIKQRIEEDTLVMSKNAAYKWAKLFEANTGSASSGGAGSGGGAGGGDGTEDGSSGQPLGKLKVQEFYALGTSDTKAPTSGWQSRALTPTREIPYLWNKEKTTYPDGTVFNGKPHLVYRWVSDGRGLISIVDYYLVSPLASGITIDTEGWTTTPPETDDTNKYLWNYEEFTWLERDGVTQTIERTTPHIVGAAGEDAFDVQITTDRGNVILNGEGQRILTAHVFKGSEEITSSITPEYYSWRRVSQNASDDEMWNQLHEAVGNTITVSAQDIFRNALFICDVCVGLETQDA